MSDLEITCVNIKSKSIMIGELDVCHEVSVNFREKRCAGDVDMLFVEINEDKAKQIIKHLTKHFNLTTTESE